MIIIILKWQVYLFTDFFQFGYIQSMREAVNATDCVDFESSTTPIDVFLVIEHLPLWVICIQA